MPFLPASIIYKIISFKIDSTESLSVSHTLAIELKSIRWNLYSDYF
jgi:hypothetical protein